MTPDQLVASAEALLDLDARGALAPHGIGGHARTIIEGFLALASRPSAIVEEPTEADRPHKIAQRMREIIQDVWDKREGYTDRQAWSDLHGQAMQLLEWDVSSRKSAALTVEPEAGATGVENAQVEWLAIVAAVRAMVARIDADGTASQIVSADELRLVADTIDRIAGRRA